MIHLEQFSLRFLAQSVLTVAALLVLLFALSGLTDPHPIEQSMAKMRWVQVSVDEHWQQV